MEEGIVLSVDESGRNPYKSERNPNEFERNPKKSEGPDEIHGRGSTCQIGS
jgi:hypothetical protein